MNICIPFKVGDVSLEAFYLATARTEIYTQRRVGQLGFSFGTTKLPAHLEDGDGVNVRNVGKPHPDAAVLLTYLLHGAESFLRSYLVL
jgi:hypothetical protein